MAEDESSLNYQILIVFPIFLFYSVAEPYFHHKKIFFLHESGLSILVGFLVSLFIYFVYPDSPLIRNVSFNSDFFFTIILPPIIFSAGFNLRRRRFFKYIVYIVSLGLIGTVINFLLVTVLTFYANRFDLFYFTNSTNKDKIDFTLNDILMFAAVISATDTIAALTFVKEEENPKLCSILFGEGVVNDAIAIVLYRIIKEFNQTDERVDLNSF